MKLALAGLIIVAVSAAHAEAPAVVRVGDHPGFGRVVFDLPAASTFQMSERGSRVVLTFTGGPSIGTPESAPRNVVSILGGEGSATLTLAPGAKIRATQIGSRVVVDILDPAARARSGNPAAPPSQPPAAATATPGVTVPIAAPERVTTPERATTPARATPPEPAVASEKAAAPGAPPTASEQPKTPQPAVEPLAPIPAAASAPAPALAPAPGKSTAPLRVPAKTDVGVAAFRRGNFGVVVFDSPIVIDAQQFQRLDGFADATVRDAGKATMLLIPLDPDTSLQVTREKEAWAVRLGKAEVPAAENRAIPEGIGFPFAEPGRVVTVQDPETGQTLLLGTSRASAGKGRSVAEQRRAPGYVLLPTWLGLALEPSSDEVALRASLSGFTLVTPDSMSPAKTASAMAESRFGLPSGPVPVLLRQLQAAIAGAAGTPPRARGKERLAAARAMLSLGLASEAQAVLTLAGEDEPTIASDPVTAALFGIAAVLAGRPAEATGLDTPALERDEEIVLWRALRDTALGKPAGALGRALPVAMIYPEAVRTHILPAVVEAAIRDGQPMPQDEALAKLPSLDFARALAAERDGKVDEALSLYDAVGNGRDLSDSVRAEIAGAELRVAKGTMLPAQAAALLERETVRWRGDARELATRLRAAEFRVQAAQWRMALESLRETETLFPSAKADIGTRKSGVFKTLAKSGKDSVNPLEMVTLLGDFADCIPDGEDGESVAAVLGEKLIALDLPSRAVPVLQRLLAGAKSSRTKAEFALALGQMHLDLGEPTKAETVLRSVEGSDLAPERAEARSLLLARARAGQGDNRTAAEILAAVASPAANELRASLSAQAGDWKESLKALRDLSSKLVTADGELSEKQQDLLLREAVAAVQAGDGEVLGTLKASQARMTGPRGDQFRVLTATSIQGITDLPRAAGELAMSRSFSGRLDSANRR